MPSRAACRSSVTAWRTVAGEGARRRGHRNPCKEMGWLPVDVVDAALVNEWLGRARRRSVPLARRRLRSAAGRAPAALEPADSEPGVCRRGRGVEHLGMQFHIEMTPELVTVGGRPRRRGRGREERARTGGPGVQSPRRCARRGATRDGDEDAGLAALRPLGARAQALIERAGWSAAVDRRAPRPPNRLIEWFSTARWVCRGQMCGESRPAASVRPVLPARCGEPRVEARSDAVDEVRQFGMSPEQCHRSHDAGWLRSSNDNSRRSLPGREPRQRRRRREGCQAGGRRSHTVKMVRDRSVRQAFPDCRLRSWPNGRCRAAAAAARPFSRGSSRT